MNLNTIEATVAEVERGAAIDALVRDYTRAGFDYAAAGRRDLLLCCQMVVARLQDAQELAEDLHYFLDKGQSENSKPVT